MSIGVVECEVVVGWSCLSVRVVVGVLAVVGLSCLLPLGGAGLGGCFSDSRPRGSGVVSVSVSWCRVGVKSEILFKVVFLVSEVRDSLIRDCHDSRFWASSRLAILAFPLSSAVLTSVGGGVTTRRN